MNEIFQIFLRSAEGSFLQVTVFVGAVLILFGLINFKTQGKFVSAIENSRKLQPLLGALLGLTPGCGGAIFVTPLFVKGSVSFGTVVATLVATMGDSAFVLISTMPFEYFLVSVISFGAAIITGYVVDSLKVGEGLLLKLNKQSTEELKKANELADHMLQKVVCEEIKGCEDEHLLHVGHQEGDAIDIALHHKAKGHEATETLAYKITHTFFTLYWLWIVIGLVLGIMLLGQVDVNALAVQNLGISIGVSGTLFSIFMMILCRKFVQDDTHEESEVKLMDFRETVIHNAEETAFVGTWVFVAYLVYELSVFFLGGADSAAGEERLEGMMLSAGLLSVIVAACIGLIPGCGPQIIFVALFAKGLIPFSALTANAISQDGDALFPLLAIDKKSSLMATVITTIPALVAGVILFYLESYLGLF